MAAGGGFSYGDVLGAGEGWAKCILYNPGVRAQFAEFFADSAKFALGAGMAGPQTSPPPRRAIP